MTRAIISTICITAAIVFATSCNKAENNLTASERTVITAVAEAVGGGTKALTMTTPDGTEFKS